MNANGNVNGNGAASPQSVQVNPVECARVALMFLQRATFNSTERQMYDFAESLLRAIVEGQVVLAPPPAKEVQPPQADAPTQ